jgi:hypothetical protein
MTLKVEIQWADDVAKKFKKLWENDLVEARKRWLTESAIILQWESKKLAPVNNWQLRKSIKFSVYDTYATVYTNLFYAPFVHEWTRPHLIMPVKKKSLHWINKDWFDIFAKLVHHPWTKENPFFTKAVNNQRSKILERFNTIIQEYIND